MSSALTASGAVVWMLCFLAGATACQETGPLGAWPFRTPDPESLRAMPHKVFAHYHTQFPRSFDNLPPDADYYATQYLAIGGEAGHHQEYGGFLRDRPLPRPPLQGDWVMADLRWEVAAAAALGIDGFCIDLLEPEGVHLERAFRLAQAAAETGGTFRIVPMPDFAAGFALRPERFSTVIARFSKEPAAFRMPDGRLLVMAFDAQRMPSGWWREQIALLAAAGIDIALVPCVRYIDQHRAAFTPFCDGLGEWGVRTPAAVMAEADRCAPMHQAGKLWMAPVSPQDYRPKDLLVMEAEGATLFKTMWERAITDKADWVQLVTWNDYSEHTHIAPSPATGRIWYDLTAWYVTAFKAGYEPTVTRDALSVVLRTRPAGGGPGGRGRARFDPPGSGVDILQAVVWAVAPADLVCGASRRSCRAGLNILTFPADPAVRQCRLERDGLTIQSIAVPAPLQGEGREDLLYHSLAAAAAPGGKP